MIKCVCERTCQVRMPDKKIRTFVKGDVERFKECPPNFRAIEGPKKELTSDLGTASEQELLEGAYTVKQLRDFADSVYGQKLKGTSKEDVVASFLDARFRNLEEHEAEGVL